MLSRRLRSEGWLKVSVIKRRTQADWSWQGSGKGGVEVCVWFTLIVRNLWHEREREFDDF